MDCCYLSRNENPTTEEDFGNISSPEMFDSDEDEYNQSTEIPLNEVTRIIVSPQKPTQTELITKSDHNLLARINKYLSGVPPPPKHTICRTDCAEFLLHIYENRHLFCTPCPLVEKEVQQDVAHKPQEQENESPSRNISYQRTRNTSRNLTNAFDACDLQYPNSSSNNPDVKDLQQHITDNSRIQLSVPGNAKNVVDTEITSKNIALSPEQEQADANESKEQASSNFMQESLFYHTVGEEEATHLTWPAAYNHNFHGMHYNRNTSIEEYENLTIKLCDRYIGAETQSTCNVWFSKQAPGSARKRSLLAKCNTGQSPGKRLNHLTRRRRTFSSANLQGLALNNKKLLVLNIKKPFVKKGKSPRGKSPRGKSPRGKSPRGKSPRSSTKKKAVRRLVLDGPSPLKSKIDTSKRALFQSPPSDRAGPSKIFPTGSNPQTIKRALFPTPKKRDDDSENQKKNVVEESKKRKCDEELEGPRFKWAKSLSFDCSHELHNGTITAWDHERHSSSNIVEKNKTTFTQGRNELSDIHRKKLLWAVAEALRSKGIGMTHPQFKQYATNLARTIKKLMPDLENRNLPRKPGSTSDRMLKLAKHHVPFVIEAGITD